jgi:pantoate--beta-alanine ligase
MDKTPIVIKDVYELQCLVKTQKNHGKIIGLVPTMGFFHEGHLSLVEKIKTYCDYIVVSIYVNPAQFSPHEDLDTYPRDLKGDIEKLKRVGVDLVFTPDCKSMYPENYQSFVCVRDVTKPLCGNKRESHFEGVTTIVAKLFNIVQPNIAIFGEKDYQQLLTIKQMVRDLYFPVKIISGKTIREDDGLAKSSRNSYLSSEDREKATIIYKALIKSSLEVKNGNLKTPENIKIFAANIILTVQGAVIDYLECLDAQSLKTTESLNKPVVLACAVFFGKTRLIDNIIIK